MGEVLAVVPARKMLLARRHQHAKLLVQHAAHQVEHGVEVATPIVADIVMRAASAVWRFARWTAAELRREMPRLARVVAAEIHERNLQRAAPNTGRSHRVANEYRAASTNSRSVEAGTSARP
jgi:hypothetical protein